MIKVPFFLQELKSSCFPACLRMILSFYGIQTQEKELRDLCDVSEGRGATWFGAKDAAGSFGLNFKMKVNATIEELKNLVENGVPVIVGVDIFDLGWDKHQGHTIIILQINNELIYHDPQRGREMKMAKEKFIAIWKKRDNRLGYIEKFRNTSISL